MLTHEKSPSALSSSKEPFHVNRLLLFVEAGLALTVLPAASAWGQTNPVEPVSTTESGDLLASEISNPFEDETAVQVVEAPQPQPEFQPTVSFSTSTPATQSVNVPEPVNNPEMTAVDQADLLLARLEAEPRKPQPNLETPDSSESLEPPAVPGDELNSEEPVRPERQDTEPQADDDDSALENIVLEDAGQDAEEVEQPDKGWESTMNPAPEEKPTTLFSPPVDSTAVAAQLPEAVATVELPEDYSTEASALLNDASGINDTPEMALLELSDNSERSPFVRSQPPNPPLTARQVAASEAVVEVNTERSTPEADATHVATTEAYPSDLEGSSTAADVTDSMPAPPGEQAYLVAPQVVPNENINPFLTTRTLNGATIDHQSGISSTSGVNFGDNQNLNLNAIGTLTLNSQVEQSITAGNVLGINQSTQILQAQTIVTDREVALSQREPVGMLGEHIRMSLTASCILPGTDATQQCSYTPGLVVEESDLDPDLLIPRQIRQTANFGEVLTPESIDAIQQPGFQRGANGQQVGLDIYLPNLGLIPADGDAATHLTREESVSTAPVIGYADVHQTILANDQEASLSRTVRSPVAILGGDQSWVNIGLALASLLLPEARTSVADSDQPFNSNLNQSLFLAANNTRLPANSFTVYESGSGRAATPSEEMNELNELPPATYNTLWLGLSPETTRTVSREESLELRGDREILFDAGGEGGVDSDVEFVSLINDLPYSADNLNDVYTQVYLTVFRQNADLVNTTRQVDSTKYYPHLSYSGNITGAYDVFRYYTGVIAGEELRPYGGVDYAANTPEGWSYEAGGVAVINPSYDNYSQLFGGVEKRIDFSENSHLRLGSRLNWAIDQESQISGLNSRPEGSDVIVQAQLALGPVSTGVTQSFGDLLPNSRPSRTVSNLALDITDGISLGGYYTIADQSDTVPQAGVLLNWRLGDDKTSPILGLSWNNTRYEYGNGAFSSTANNFGVSVKMGL